MPPQRAVRCGGALGALGLLHSGVIGSAPTFIRVVAGSAVLAALFGFAGRAGPFVRFTGRIVGVLSLASC